jgi:hypothetical protein
VGSTIKALWSGSTAGAAKYDQIPGLARPCDHLDNFFEWKKTTTGKQPYAIALANRRLMGMAGLRETLALAGGRKNSQLHHHHHHAERIARRTA